MNLSGSDYRVSFLIQKKEVLLIMLEMVLPVLPRSEISIDQDAFYDWLTARRTEVVGVSCEDGSCPVSRYLTEQYQRHYYVGGDACGTSSNPASYDLPSWVSAFVHRLDYLMNYQEEDVTGEQALEVYEWAAAHADLPLFEELQFPIEF